jgi:hypothetical protein
MRIARMIFVASVAGSLILIAPALAKNSAAISAPSKTEDRSTSSSCHAYQQAADGSWTELPCQETGSGGQTQHKPAPKSPEDEPR